MTVYARIFKKITQEQQKLMLPKIHDGKFMKILGFYPK